MTKIGVCFMSIGEKYKEITSNSRKNKISYCTRHGYDFIEDESIYDTSKPIPWSKIPLILKYIDKYDYIVWIDADILIMNLTITIESIIEKYQNFDIICGSDWRMINTGFMIMTNSTFCKDFLAYVQTNVYDPHEDKNERYLNWEQGSFINLHDRNYMNCVSHIKVTQPDEMNSYWYNFFPNHFVIHFAGVRGDLLQYLLRDYYPERLDTDTDTSYNSRMEWLSGPVRDYLDEKLKHDKEREMMFIKESQFNYTDLLDQFIIYEYPINKKIRIGNIHDGGYVIPNLQYTKLFSFGVSNDTSFDEQFAEQYNVECHLYDPTINDIPKHHKSLFFQKIGLSSSETTKKINNMDCKVNTLDNLLKDFSDNTMFLKIDIEGDEYDSINVASQDTLNKFMCIVLEIHWLSDRKLSNKIEFLKKMNELFYIIHIHANNHSPVNIIDNLHPLPDVLELTYIRKDLLIDPILSSNIFPTELDNPNHGMLKEIELDFYPFRPFYISLSTIPSRIPRLNEVIDSLVNQTVKPRKIFVNIPKFYDRFQIDYVAPNLSKYDSNVVVLNVVDTDYGPATKFLPIINMIDVHEDDMVIIVDDDILYDKNMCANLIKDSYKNPDSVITTFGITNGEYLFDQSKWVIDRNTQYLEPCGLREKTEGFIDVFEAFKGTLLKKKFFNRDVFDFEDLEFRFCDDVYLSGHVLKNGYTIRTSVYDNKTSFLQNNIDALCDNVELRNKRMTNCAMHFKEKYGIW